ncbi:MAG TPA: hypothetical protein VME70_04650 [Mycobacteriales bacterium]|nr:hypothetical protein [Mycobacteriales bacterium]
MRLSLRASALIAAAVGVTAGCTAGAPSHALHPGAAPSGSATYVQATQERTRQAHAYARWLAGTVARIAGEQPLAHPPARLSKPGEVIGVGDLIVERRYWSAPGTPLAVYDALKNAPSRYRLTGYGAPGAGSDPADFAFLTYAEIPAPPYIEDSEVYVEIERISATRSAIASFAEVDTHPVRTATEAIDESGVSTSSGTYTWPRLDALAHLGHVTGYVTATLDANQRQSLIRDFDQSPVANSPSTCFGGIQISGDVLTVRLRSGGHSWKLVYPGTSCVDVAVWRDGVSLPAIGPTGAFRRLLEVLEHSPGTVVGHLIAVGGPAGVPPTPEPGVVTLSAHGHVVAVVHPRSSGAFALDAQPGRYDVSGSSPAFMIDGRRGQCTATHVVTVVATRSVRVDVLCQRR